MDFTKQTGEALSNALALDVTTASDAALAAALVPRNEALDVLLAVETPTTEQADTAEAITASVEAIEAEQEKRAETVKTANAKFAKAKEAREARIKAAAEAEAEGDDEESDEDAEESEESEVEAATDDTETASDEGDGDDEDEDAEDEGDAEGEVEASTKRAPATTRTRASKATAKALAAGNKRPAVKSASDVVITASANVDGFSLGQKMSGMDDVSRAAMNVVKAFPKFNERSARIIHDQTGGLPQIHKHGVAQFGVDFSDALTAPEKGGTSGDYNAVQAAIKEHRERMALAVSGDGLSQAALTAAAWCAPSPIVYSWIADYVVDGLITMPEISAPRGGVQITTGPRVGGESQGDTNLDGFGWEFTETEMEADPTKPFEVIDCPEFEDHRLDAVGYAFKIPILTQKAFPELVTDALRFADVMYAHKINARLINDLVTLAGAAITFNGYGPSLTDSLEALSIYAVKQRRKWNLGENAPIEVKMPVWAKEVFRADMSRRNNAPLDDPINDARLSAHFASRRLVVEYIADFEELTGANISPLPAAFTAIMYPAGAVVKAVEDVVNLSAIYDAASLSKNEYTGVFFEQAIMTAQVGYEVHKVSIPVNTAGEAGALTLTGLGDATANGSF